MASRPALSASLADVAVVILNWNGQALLRQFLPAVLAGSDDARVIVVDNASTDDSAAVLAAEFPTVQVLRHAQNLGFCEGYNQALRQVRLHLPQSGKAGRPICTATGGQRLC